MMSTLLGLLRKTSKNYSQTSPKYAQTQITYGTW